MEQVGKDGWTEGTGGAIQIDTLDHRKARSTGSSDDSIDHLEHQERLIANGQLENAIALDVQDIRARSGDKYDDPISEMVDNCYPDFQGLKPYNRHGNRKVYDRPAETHRSAGHDVLISSRTRRSTDFRKWTECLSSRLPSFRD